MEKPAFTTAALSDVRVIITIYACSCDGVAMSGVDGMGSSTQVHVVRCAWVSVATSRCVRHSTSLSPGEPAPEALPGTENPPSMTAGGLGTYRAGSYGESIVIP
jgi:hypothetical protein